MSQSHHAHLFKGLVAEHREKVLLAMSGGVGRKMYQRLVGQLQGLDDALKLSEEADFKLNGDDVVNR
jgi:hypothetical protein